MIVESQKACFESHMGLWHVEPTWFASAFESVRSGVLKPMSVDEQARRAAQMQGFLLRDDGTAIIKLQGHLTKGGDSFGGGSTVRTRKALRAAASQFEVQRILMVIDSPGGNVAGTSDLARDVAVVNQRKPVFAFAEDCCASGAYFVASQARRIFATPTTELGSIGTILLVIDASRAFDMAGLEAVVLSTGPFKGAGATGTEVTEAHRAYFQERVDALNEHFLSAVRQGRRLNERQLRAAADGRVHIAETARSLGLIDEIRSLDEVLAEIASPSRGDQLVDDKTFVQKLKVAMGMGAGPQSSADDILEAAKEEVFKVPEVMPAPVKLSSPELDQKKMVATLNEAKEIGRQAGIAEGHARGLEEGQTVGAKEGYALGYTAGREDASQIAASCHIAEQPGRIAGLLAQKVDGSYYEKDTARAALQMSMTQESDINQILSHTLPSSIGSTEEPLMSSRDTFELREQMRQEQLKRGY